MASHACVTLSSRGKEKFISNIRESLATLSSGSLGTSADSPRILVAVKCQGKAVANNTAETFVDPDVLLHKDHPVQFPFSAYAYKPGLRLGEYAAEQMANAVEHGEAGVVSHVKSVAMNVTDGGNVTALNLTTVGDRRQSGMKF